MRAVPSTSSGCDSRSNVREIRRRSADLLRQGGAGGIREGKERVDGAFLLDVRIERQELAAGRLRRGDEGGGAPHDVTRLHDFQGRTADLPGRYPGGDGGAQGQSGGKSEDGADHSLMIAPR